MWRGGRLRYSGRAMIAAATIFLQHTLSILSLQRPLRRLPHLFIFLLFSLTSCNSGVTAQQTVYHMCDTLEKQYSYLCPNHTLFNQKFMVCDHWYMVNCSSAQDFYHLNVHIGEGGSGNPAVNSLQVSTEAGHDTGHTSTKDVKTSSLASTFKSSRSDSPQQQASSLTLTPTRRITPPFAPTSIPTQPLTPASKPTQPLIPTSTPTQPFILRNIPTDRFIPTNIFTLPFTTTNTVTTAITESVTIKDSQVGLSQPWHSPTLPPITKPIAPPTTQPVIPPTAQPITPPISFTGLLKPLTVPFNFLTLPTTSDNSPLQSIIPPLHLSLPNLRHTSSQHGGLLRPSRNSNITQRFGAAVRAFSAITSSTDTSTLVDTTNTWSAPTRDTTEPEIETTNSQTPRSDPSFTMVPGRVARRPGRRFTFSSNGEEPSLKPVDVKNIALRPLVVRPASKTRTIPNTSSEVTLVSHFPNATLTDQVTQHSLSSELAPPLVSSTPRNSFEPRFPANHQRLQVPTDFLQPPSLHPVSLDPVPFLSPANLSASPIRNVIKQEFPTPLFTPVRNSRVRVFEQTIPEAPHVQFSSSRGNRDFFIPTNELSLPGPDLSQVDQNSLDEELKHQDTSEHHHHDGDGGFHMTMVFPAPPEERMEELQLNPECPRCHPAFLRPGECHPCVLIK
ncbi:mucin-2-like isoform X2 [Cherax quadricarinatus]|uniref:mucin-2-like isoform X2 n=1 Tax=Cherax quadricarinatus TaxID=27406 RepID=UPI00387E8896